MASCRLTTSPRLHLLLSCNLDPLISRPRRPLAAHAPHTWNGPTPAPLHLQLTVCGHRKSGRQPDFQAHVPDAILAPLSLMTHAQPKLSPQPSKINHFPPLLYTAQSYSCVIHTAARRGLPAELHTGLYTRPCSQTEQRAEVPELLHTGCLVENSSVL